MSRRRRNRIARVLPVLATTFLLFAGCGGAGDSDDESVTADLPSTTSASPSRPDPEVSSNDEETPDPAESSDDTEVDDPTGSPGSEVNLPTGIVPVRITIPAIGVDADVIDLDLSGPEPEVPADFAQTGWYTQTRRPGEIGPSVLAGHIDSVDGPAVFSRLDELQPGDEIVVDDEAGDSRTFVVTGAGQYPKEALPDEVFGFKSAVELRLITCGGTFDRAVGHYRDNYVVYTELLPTVS